MSEPTGPSPAGPAPLPAAELLAPAEPGRHRACGTGGVRRLRPGVLWPLAAVVVTGLVGASTAHSTPLPTDDTLAGPAAALLGGGPGPTALSPTGSGAVHAAVYATVTRAFDRHATLAGAEREFLLVLLLAAAVLLWRTARRLDLPDPACALAVVALGGVPALASLHAAASPAAVAVVWLLLAGWLATWVRAAGRAAAAVTGAVALATVLGVLLAPDAVLLLTAAGAAVAAGRVAGGRRRAGLVGAGLLALVAVRAALPRWDPQPADPARWGGSPAGLAALTVVLLVIAGLAAWQLPRFRAAGTALAATALLAVAPPSGRLPALLLCVPLGALLLGALAAAAAERAVAAGALPGRRAVLAAGLAGALVLTGLGAAAAADVASGPRTDFGASAADGLVGWAGDQLPAGTALTTSPQVAAELVHAGADPALVRTGTVAPVAADAGAPPVLQVTADRVPDGGREVARFGDLTVVDVQPVTPSAELVTARRDLAAALLANPTTQVPAADAEKLAAGQVDPRLLLLLAGIGARFGLDLAGLPAAPGEPADSPARQAVVAGIDGRSLAGDPAAADRLRTWLAAQRAPYAPDRVADVDGGLLVGYRVVRDPDGLIPRPEGG